MTSLLTPVLGVSSLDKVVICAEKPEGYKDYTPHYQYRGPGSIPRFPPGSTVYVYVEATGTTEVDDETGQYEPDIEFKLECVRPTDSTFTKKVDSDELINEDRSPFKRTYDTIEIKLDKDAAEGKYEFVVEARDKNAGNIIIGTTPCMYFYVDENATIFPPTEYIYTDLEVEPEISKVGKTVTVSVNIVNLGGIGNKKGENVVLFLNGEQKSVKNVKLEHDESKVVEFKLKKELDRPGAYKIEVGDLSGEVTMGEREEVPSERRVPGFTVIPAIIGIISIAYLMKRRMY
jgi:hypothetical protein